MVIAVPRDLMMLWGICSDTLKIPLYKDAPKKSLWAIFAAIECVALFMTGIVEMPDAVLFVFLITLGSFCMAFF
jgi:hypothetical protein